MRRELALIRNTAARYGGLATAPDAAAGPVKVTIVRTQRPLPIDEPDGPPTLTDAWQR